MSITGSPRQLHSPKALSVAMSLLRVLPRPSPKSNVSPTMPNTQFTFYFRDVAVSFINVLSESKSLAQP